MRQIISILQYTQQQLEILNNTCTILTKINVNFHFIHQTFFFETKTSTISLYNTFFCAQLGSPPIRNLSSKFSDGYIFFNALKGLKNSFSTSVTLESTLSFGVIGTLQVQDSMIHTIRTQKTYNQNTKTYNQNQSCSLKVTQEKRIIDIKISTRPASKIPSEDGRISFRP